RYDQTGARILDSHQPEQSSRLGRHRLPSVVLAPTILQTGRVQTGSRAESPDATRRFADDSGTLPSSQTVINRARLRSKRQAALHRLQTVFAPPSLEPKPSTHNKAE